MTIDTLPLDCASIHGTFQQWQAEQEPLTAQLNESLSALAAYQSHLDDWQQQLAREREELAAARAEFDAQRKEIEQRDTQSAAKTAAELKSSGEQIASLTDTLLTRSEELRRLESRRAEIAADLDLYRARERELRTALEEQKSAHTQEIVTLHEDLRQLRESAGQHAPIHVEQPAVAPTPPATRPTPLNANRPSNSPVLDSIVEQFGKLRQQRAHDRAVHQKPR